MPVGPVIQPSFAAGELAPGLSGRVDLAKYKVGAKLMRNFFSRLSGGASTRPGTEFIGRCKISSSAVRLIPFTFSTVQTYALEFGHLYLRVIKDGGYVLEPSKAITGATRASPCQLTIAGHGFVNGDELFLDGVGGMVQLNEKNVIIANVTTNSFTLKDLDGTAIDSTAYAAFTSGGTAARVYTLTTPWAAADLALLKYAQSADVMTFCHPSYVPYDLTRTNHWLWTLTALTFQSHIGTPTGLSASGVNAGSGTSFTYSYKVTALTGAPFEESPPSSAVTCTNTALDQNTGIVNKVSWTAVSGATQYRVYAAVKATSSGVVGTVYGYIGASTTASFQDDNRAPDFSIGPPSHTNPFAGGNNPGCVVYFEGRKVFAGCANNPTTVYLSQPGNYGNFDASDPTRDSDAITATLTANQVNAVKHLVSMNSLLALTSQGAWMISGGSTSDAITPANTVAKPQAYNGCSDVPPITVNYDILYVQAKGSVVRDLAYNYYVNIYTGDDKSILSSHLFYGYRIMDWTWAEEPFKIIWCVRNDGILLSFTYLKEQDIYAWARHDTGITDCVRSVCSISEGPENSVYLVVDRVIPGVNGGQVVKYVERLHTRNFYTAGVADVTQAWCVDCGAQYAGSPTTTVTGLDYLNGAKVSILADGNVQPQQVVTNGTVTVQAPSSTITIGLPFVAQLQTMPLDLGEPTVQGKRKKAAAVTLILEDSRGLKVGPTFDRLTEIKERTTQGYGVAIPLTSGEERVIIDPLYAVAGSVAIQQDQPLPATVLAVIPEVTIGDTTG